MNSPLTLHTQPGPLPIDFFSGKNVLRGTAGQTPPFPLITAKCSVFLFSFRVLALPLAFQRMGPPHPRVLTFFPHLSPFHSLPPSRVMQARRPRGRSNVSFLPKIGLFSLFFFCGSTFESLRPYQSSLPFYCLTTQKTNPCGLLIPLPSPR